MTHYSPDEWRSGTGEPIFHADDIETGLANPPQAGDVLTAWLQKFIDSEEALNLIVEASLSLARWKGTWHSGTDYALADEVILNGTIYGAKVANTNHNPERNPSHWETLTGKRLLAAMLHRKAARVPDVDGPADGTVVAALVDGAAQWLAREQLLTVVDTGGVAYLPDADDPAHGLEIKQIGADAGWLLRTQAPEGRTNASAIILGENHANRIILALPPSLAGEETGNDWDLDIDTAADTPHPAQAASVRIHTASGNRGILVTAVTAGTDGNDLSISVTTPYGAGYPTASWDGDVLDVRTGTNQRTDALISAINAARDDNGNQLVVASYAGSTAGTAIEWIHDGEYHLSGGAAAVSGEPVAFFVDPETETLTVRARATSTLQDIFDVVADSVLEGANHIDWGEYVTSSGDLSDTILDGMVGTTFGFTGGVLPGTVGFTANAAAKEVVASYRPESTFGDLLDADPPDGLAVALIRDTSRGAKPTAVGQHYGFDVPQRAVAPVVGTSVIERTGANVSTLRMSSGTGFITGSAADRHNFHDIVYATLEGFHSQGKFRGKLSLHANIAGYNFPDKVYFRPDGNTIVPTTDGSDTALSDWRGYLGNFRRMFHTVTYNYEQISQTSRTHSLVTPTLNVGETLHAVEQQYAFAINFNLPGLRFTDSEFTALLSTMRHEREHGLDPGFNQRNRLKFRRIDDARDTYEMILAGYGTEGLTLKVRDIIYAMTHHNTFSAHSGEPNYVAVNGENIISVPYYAPLKLHFEADFTASVDEV